MNELRDAYLSVYEPTMTQRGFQRKGIIFHRLFNEKIIQMLSYLKFRYSFTIQFCIYPLCAGYEYTTFLDETRLGSLIGNEAYAEWEHDGSGYLEQMKESLKICEEYLFPNFENVYNYRSYYDYVIRKYNKKLAKLSDVYKNAYGNFLRAPMDDAFFMTSLAIGEYNNAKISRETVIMQNEDAMESNRRYGVEPTAEKLKNLEDLRNEYRQMKNAMDINDREYIDAFIRRNEQYSLESYRKNYKVKP